MLTKGQTKCCTHPNGSFKSKPFNMLPYSFADADTHNLSVVSNSYAYVFVEFESFILKNNLWGYIFHLLITQMQRGGYGVLHGLFSEFILYVHVKCLS